MANLNNGSAIPASNSAVNLTVNNTNTNSLRGNSMTNSIAFTNAFDGANYSEVAPIVNYGPSIVNFEGKGTSIAQFLVNGLFPIKEISHLANDSEEQRAKTEASVKASNEIAVANQAAFINNYGPKLGYVSPTTLVCARGFAFDKANHVLKGILKALFTIKVTTRGDDPKFYGLEEQVNNNIVNVSNASLVWFSVLAAATANLTVSDRANFISIMFAKTCLVEGNIITRDNVSIDLAQGTVTLSGRVLKVNKACNFGMDGANFIVLDGLHSIFMFALQALGGSAKQLTTAINLAVSLFAPEHNYGHKPDSDDMAFFVRANLIYSSAVEGTHTSFPTFGIVAGKQHPNFLGWVINKGVTATSDKTNIKFVTINAGAEAVGIGFNKETGSFMTANDAGKPTKFFNRPAANNYDCADMVGRQASKFGFALSNGKVARTKGALKKVAFTNSVLGFGSGVAVLNKNSSFQFSVAKKIKETVSLSLFGAGFVNNPAIKQQLILSLTAKLDGVVAQQASIKPGDSILCTSVAGSMYELVTNTEAVADVVVTGGVVKTNSMDENAVDIIVDVVINADSSFVKTRRFGTKFTTLPYEANFVGEDFEWDIILNNETVKGQGALLEMFANATGERVLNSSTGEFVSPCGDVINLLNADNKFNEWKLSSVKKDVKLQMEIAKSVWAGMSKWAMKANVVVVPGSETATSVVVEETLDVIFGELVFDVEISTALESVSKSSFTLESAAAVYLQNARLGGILFDACKANTNRFTQLANNFSGANRASLTVVDVTNVDDMTAFVEVACVSNNQSKAIKAISVAYPNGVSFVFNQAKANINFGLVSEFGQFSKLNGGAISDASAIYALVLSLINGGLTTQTLSDAQKAFNKIVTTAVDSSNVLKKATRSGGLVYGKVRTSYSPLLNSEDGIPIVVMNEKCAMVQKSGIRSSGEFVGFARTPMPFLGGARVILTNDESICDVAHVLVDPFVWASLCEGDSRLIA
jgi:hypothetical protein